MKLAPAKWPNGDVIGDGDRMTDPFDLCSPLDPNYVELRERADDRLRGANSPGQVLQSLKLLVYVQNRAYREAGLIV